MRNLTELSQAKFSDKEFGEFFNRSVKKDIGKIDLLLESFLKYLAVNTPLKKKDTVHRLIEEVLDKYQVQLEEKGVKLSKKFERCCCSSSLETGSSSLKRRVCTPAGITPPEVYE